jgi:hypothetical protein
MSALPAAKQAMLFLPSFATQVLMPRYAGDE